MGELANSFMKEALRVEAEERARARQLLGREESGPAENQRVEIAVDESREREASDDFVREINQRRQAMFTEQRRDVEAMRRFQLARDLLVAHVETDQLYTLELDDSYELKPMAEQLPPNDLRCELACLYARKMADRLLELLAEEKPAPVNVGIVSGGPPIERDAIPEGRILRVDVETEGGEIVSLQSRPEVEAAAFRSIANGVFSYTATISQEDAAGLSVATPEPDGSSALYEALGSPSPAWKPTPEAE